MVQHETCVLAVDDEPRILKLVQHHLGSAGYRVVTATNGRNALEMAQQHAPDLIVLDLMLPRMDGFEVCKRLREFSQAAVIMLTAKNEEQDKVQGFEVGADDYLTKPFSPQELIARVKAVLRRTAVLTEPKQKTEFEHGDLRMDFVKRRVFVRGQEIRLSPTEYKLLYQLVTNQGKVMPHEELLRKVWGPEYLEEVHYIREYIRHLRQKVEPEPGKPQYILSEPGVGYRFADPIPAEDIVAAD